MAALRFFSLSAIWILLGVLCGCRSDVTVIRVPDEQGLMSFRYELGELAARLGEPRDCALVWQLDRAPSPSLGCRQVRVEWPASSANSPIRGYFCPRDSVLSLSEADGRRAWLPVTFSDGSLTTEVRGRRTRLPTLHERSQFGALLNVASVRASETAAEVFSAVRAGGAGFGFIAWPLVCSKSLDNETYQRAVDG